VKPAATVPSPLSIETALAQSTPLSRLVDRMRESRQRFEAVAPHLPPRLRAHVTPGPIDDEAWSLLAANSAVASKLRQLQPRLAQALAEAGWAPRQIRIKVVAAG
jgi:hypothetical protein